MATLSLDWETRSTVDLTKTGVYPYAESATTDIWCGAWAFDDEEPAIWVPGMPVPHRIVAHVQAGGEIRAWNAQFERVIWAYIAGPRYGWPAARLEQFVCSAAEAAAMALPRSLDGAAHAVGAAAQKDKEGYALMLRMSRPRKIEDDGTPVWWTDEERLQKLYAYCQQDVRTERAIIRSLRRLTATERDVYLLDQRLNDRGIRIDLDLVLAAQDIALEGVNRANAALAELTNGEVTAVTNHGRLAEWVRRQGVATEGVSQPAVRALLDGELPAHVRQALVIRAEAARSSIAKLASMLECRCADGRIRGMHLYHAASTGRWAGRLVQVQNFPRGDVKKPERFIDLILARDYDALDLLDNPVAIVSSLLRGMLTAGTDNVLVAADYSAIEARVVNWLAGQNDMLSLFRAYDAAPKAEKPKYDPYRHNAVRFYKIPLDDVQPFPHRHTGKFQELACGFGMGAKKAVDAAKDIYQIEITAAQAKEIVTSYRETHEKVVAFWYETEDACKQAISTPGVAVTFGGQRNLKAIKAGAYLYLILPSKRPLCYASPRIIEAETPWSRQAREDWTIECGVLDELGIPQADWPEEPKVQKKPTIDFLGVHPKTKQWVRERTYGGKLVENIVQAVARDLMAEGMLRADAAGFPTVMTVHDEVVSEIEELETAGYAGDREMVKKYEDILTTLPAWAVGCPVAAEGWLGFRYRK